MRLSYEGLKNRDEWEQEGYRLPQFNIERMLAETQESPEWIHFGGGNIFRAFPAAVSQKLLDEGILKTGIIVAEGFDYEIVEKAYRQYDNLSILATLCPDGSIEKTVIASVAESLCMNSNSKDWNRLIEIFKAPTLKIASFTITEKGYSLVDQSREFTKDILADFEHGPDFPISYMGKLTALCYERFRAGGLPLTLVSMDNCSHNGTKLKEAVTCITKKWIEGGKAEPQFLAFMTDKVSYPWSMIDKITPRPASEVEEHLKATGLEDLQTYITSRNTYCAPFVNAEEPQYLVIEDDFAGERLALDKGGIIFTSRETVDKVERMKVCTCLNPLHTALAIFGCLLGYHKISDEMKDEDLKALVYRLGYKEGLPVVENPGIIKPEQFLEEVLTKRLPNPFIPDSPQRIATDTSLKLSIRFGETIKAYLKKDGQVSLSLIPLVLAGWCRYLTELDDKGETYTLSPDPILASLTPVFRNIKLGETGDIHSQISGVLRRDDIFGVNLYEAGLGRQVEEYFGKMMKGPGAVRNTLKDILS